MTSESWPEWFYSHVIGRDLAYSFSGGLFICIVQYTLWGNIFIPNQLSLELLGFVLISYFIGLLLLDFQTKIFPSLHVLATVNNESELLFLQSLIENYDTRIINLRERAIYQRVIGISVGSSVLWGGVIMIIVAFSRWLIEAVHPSANYIMLTFSLVILGIYMYFYAKEQTLKLQNSNNKLAVGKFQK